MLINHKMKKFLATVLLSGVVIMNTGMFCQSLCLGERGEKNHGHASHAAHVSHKTAKHEMPQSEGEHCPLPHEMAHDTSHGAQHTMPEVFIKCHCHAEDEASSVYYEVTLFKTIKDLLPGLQVVSIVIHRHLNISSIEPIPLEGPPKILS